MLKAFLLRAWAIIDITVKRLLAQWQLALVTVLGLVASISLVISIPLYADAVNHRIFLEKVTGNTNRAGTEPGSLPLSFMFYYYGGWYGNLQWEEIQPFDEFVAKSAEGPILGMPVQAVARYFSTDGFDMYPPQAGESNYKDLKSRMGTATIGFMSGIEEHINVVEGNFPQPAGPAADSAIDVLVSLPFANKLGLQIGENYVILARGETETGSEMKVPFPVRIAGVWEPKDSTEPYWMFSTTKLEEDVLLVSEQTFAERVSPLIPGEVKSAIWFITLDGTNISSSDVASLLGRIDQLKKTATQLLPNVKDMRSPEEALVAYNRAVNKLTILLYAFAVPIIGLILAFISLVSSLMIERKRNEMAVTRSRGATASQMLGSVALESAVLGVISLAISIPVAILLTKVIGQARSFMDFSARSDIRVNLTPAAWQAGLITVVVALVAVLIPAISAIRHTIVSYKLERARLVRPPWWQRVWLDLLLLIPVWYGMYMLKKQGNILALGQSDPLGNPLLFLIPSLAVLACTLIILRLIPLLMGAIAWVAARTRMVGLLLASRQLSRSPGHYNTPFLILVFTLSLSAYTASLAQTLDEHLYAKIYYQIGADMRFTEIGESNQSAFAQSQANLAPEFFFFPVTEYLKLPEVQAVSRVGNYRATASLNGGVDTAAGRFYGIDRIDFPSAAFWRRDFATANLGTLMNALGATPNGVLVPKRLGLAKGDPINLTVATDVGNVKLDAEVVGSFDLFPTWYEEQDGALFVGNLDYLFQEAGGDSPYQVWVKVVPNLDYANLKKLELPALNIRVISWSASIPNIRQVQQRPEQQGVFGFLFIGFAAAAILTVVGFLLYALFSYQRRFVELGVLRAGGLARGQMTTYLAFELIFLILFGGIVGTALGAWMSARFIPYLQIGTDVASRIPPFKIIIAWNSIFQIYALFGLLFVVTLVVLVVLLERMKIFQAIKLGETV